MIAKLTTRRIAATAGIAAALSLGALAAAPADAASLTSAASTDAAASVVPFASQGCSGDACIHVTTPSGGKVTVHGWAYDETFYGHFELTGPNGLVDNSSTTWYDAGGSGPSWTVAAVVGQYCITAWEYYGGKYDNLGRACESVE